ncbi:MAG: 3-deoxy-8-phosphooctulonate synthase [Candidatus Omnitrophica bacterium]|nr:3-deoxy-8-phosphooctulonate synthase [Candidatus Omnitrophota bacterium]
MNFNFEDIFSFKNGRSKFFLICGPCVIESEKMALDHAAVLKDICSKLNVPFIFKSSFDKANRTSINSFRGPGIKKGLAILNKIKKQLRIPVTSDVHQPNEIAAVKTVLDIIQIPALLSRQTDLIVAAAKSKKIINVKKGQFMAPWDMQNVIKKIESAGNKKIIITERGTSFGYHNLVSDMRSIAIMRGFGYPVVFDATHSVQLPSAGNGKSSGERKFAPVLSLAAIASGAQGLFLEVHKSPEKALCDGPNMLTLAELECLLVKAIKIREIVND